ncbi:hypothetical protein, partial [Klebsiella pneumoniae]|uniref:hypothetical protein n=1 Tax=Klebsiella pneumoniae TaxID=573 RepID=UPI003464A028
GRLGYLPFSEEVESPEAVVLNEVADAVKLDEGLIIGWGIGEEIHREWAERLPKVYLDFDAKLSSKRRMD